jgi:DNA-binding protein HU-beta
VNKDGLVKVIANDCGLTEKDVKKVIESLIDVIPKTLLKEKITINGFGVFDHHERGARIGRNPQTGEPLNIPKKTVPTFTPAKAFSVIVNAL